MRQDEGDARPWASDEALACEAECTEDTIPWPLPTMTEDSVWMTVMGLPRVECCVAAAATQHSGGRARARWNCGARPACLFQSSSASALSRYSAERPVSADSLRLRPAPHRLSHRSHEAEGTHRPALVRAKQRARGRRAPVRAGVLHVCPRLNLRARDPRGLPQRRRRASRAPASSRRSRLAGRNRARARMTASPAKRASRSLSRRVVVRVR